MMEISGGVAKNERAPAMWLGAERGLPRSGRHAVRRHSRPQFKVRVMVQIAQRPTRR
jgi:hypothetical protein